MRRFLKQILPERLVWLLGDILVWLHIDKPTLWDISKSERIVEYGWAIRALPHRGIVADIGCCGTMFSLVLASMGYKVYGTDRKKCNIKHPNFRFNDNINFKELDAVTLISTIEHIPGDIKYMETLYELLPDKTRVIITAPFGQAAQFKGHRVYDIDRVQALWPGDINLDFFTKKNEVWVKSSLMEASRVVQNPKEACSCIFCGVFTK